MPISPVGNNKSAQSGFTLVEILAVMLIIGLMAGAVIMNMPHKPEAVEVRGRVLATHIGLTAQKALIEQQPFGLSFTQTGYDILKYSGQDYSDQNFSGQNLSDQNFSGQNWEIVEEFEFDLEKPPVLSMTQNAAKIDLEAAAKTGIPVIRYDRTGLGTVFELVLDDGKTEYVIKGAIDGSVQTEVKS